MAFASLYKKVTNFVELEYTRGEVFRLSLGPGERVSNEFTVFVNGTHYSSIPGRGAVRVDDFPIEVTKSMITKQFSLKLSQAGFATKGGVGHYQAFRERDEIDHPHKDVFQLYAGFVYRFPVYQGRVFLVVDPHLVFQSVASVAELISKGCGIENLSDFQVSYDSRFGIDGYLRETRRSTTSSGFECDVFDYRDEAERTGPANEVFPEPRPELLTHLLRLLGRNFDVTSLQRQYSFLNSKTAAKDRFASTDQFINDLKTDVFPLEFGKHSVRLKTSVAIRL
ncbi:MAG: hypothetical protein JRN62_01035 [Nitrososphaerota archaeon]|nr:hypothetical protein [Nitrososphaerota archaeon]